MTNASFLDKIAKIIIENHSNDFSNTIIVLPNKRAKVFLIEALKKQISKTIFAPDIISIEDFIEDISGIRSVDPIALVFEFYELYLSITEKEKQQSFELFANWAKTLLQDFNEIDRYLLEPDKILKYLDDIKEIEHWSVDAENRTDLIDKHLEFWKLLPNYYHSFYAHLYQKGLGYQGMIYREAVKKTALFSAASNKKYLFAGFNALNKAEEKIVQYLLNVDQAKIYWDIDAVFFNDPAHEAGLFTRRMKQSWDYYKTNPFEWIVQDFSEAKNIEIIGTAKTIGQARIAGNIIENEIATNPEFNLNKTAIVLGEENILIPLLHSLPAGVGRLNITMGYSAKNNPVQILIAKLFKMHSNALVRSESNYLFYYKDILDVLTHPLVEPYLKATDLVKRINQQNYTFITYKRVLEIQENQNSLFQLLFNRWSNDTVAVLETVISILETLKNNLNKEDQEEKIAKAFLYAIFKTINQLINYAVQYQHINTLETLYSIYKQVVDLTEVSFEGEPLNGLQIMGILESRVLDFETVIITSMNEGQFPAGKSQNSFIPYDVKKEFELPTFKEKDAIYTYHFYHLLQRAKKVYLLYNTESDGIDAGEKSRFLTQLEIEKQPNHQLTHDIYNAILPELAHQTEAIPKSEAVMERLHEIAQNGFSPSALTSYIRNPIDFYFQKILHIREVEEVEESIALNTLGTIIHETLNALYQPFIGRFITKTDLQNCLNQIDNEVLNQFKLVYKEGEIKKGRNLLAFEMAKRNVYNFLKLEIESLEKGDTLKIIALEETFERWLEHPDLPFPVLIKGNVDRIEERNGIVRIIDYKTGKVERRNVMLKTWDKLTSDLKNDKIIQILIYAYSYQKQLNGKPMEAGIISFKNLKSGFLPFNFKADKEIISIIDDTVLENFIDQIVILLQEIFDKNIPFEEKT